MIFHGTERPAQPNDLPLQKQRNAAAAAASAAAGSAPSSYSSEIEHNSLEFEAGDNDQWRDEHQVRWVDVCVCVCKWALQAYLNNTSA